MKKLRRIMKITAISLLLITLLAGSVFAAENEEILIGISKIVAHPALDSVEKGIQDELADLGFANVKYDLQNANGDPNAAKQIAEKFKNEKVTIAVGIATPTAQALVGTITDIPVVFSAVTDPVGAGLVKSDTQGTANVTGVSDMTPIEEQLKMLVRFKEIKKVGHIYSSNEANSKTIAKILKKACKKMKIKYYETTVTNSAEVKQAAKSIMRRIDALYVGTDNTVVSALGSVTDVAIKYKKPIMSADPSSAKELDVLTAYGFNYYGMGRETGKLIAEILNGKSTTELPTRYITDPAAYDLVLNLDVAKKIQLVIPSAILDQATYVIDGGVGKEK